MAKPEKVKHRAHIADKVSAAIATCFSDTELDELLMLLNRGEENTLVNAIEYMLNNDRPVRVKQARLSMKVLTDNDGKRYLPIEGKKKRSPPALPSECVEHFKRQKKRKQR
jgi:hypothetical protein